MGTEISEFERRRKIVQDDRDYTSAKVSDLARYIGFGLAGSTFLLATSASSFAQRLVSDFKIPILLASAVGCVTVLCDYLQYLFGYKSSDQAYLNIKNDTDLYDPHSKYYRARQLMFNLKHYLSIGGSLIFIAILIGALFQK